MQAGGLGLGLGLLKCRNLLMGNWGRSAVRNFKVAVVGAGGGIGQPLSLLLKLNPMVCELVLLDIQGVKGVAMDLSHICTQTHVESFEGKGHNQQIDALKDADIVVVPAGMPRKPGMDRAELLSANGNVAISVTRAVSKACPKALLAFITNPINSVLPIAAESMKSLGCHDPNRLFGVTTLDVVRGRAFIAQLLDVNPNEVNLPVIGGHAGITILPIISQCCPQYHSTPEERKKLVKRIQEAGTEVVEAKAGTGSATLSMAYAAALFVDALLHGLNNEPNVAECAYVESNVTEAAFFSSPLELGPNGIKSNLGLPDMDAEEKEALQKMLPELKQAIEDGLKFAQEAIGKAKAAEKTKKC